MSSITQNKVNILFPFSSSYSAKFSASELSKLTKIPQQTASRILNDLAKESLISYERKGKNKLFYFDLEKITTKNLIEIIENQKSLEFLQKNKEIAIIMSELLEHSESIMVFGSYSSSKQKKDSDLDILIVGKHNKEKIKETKRKLYIEVNEHILSKSEFKKLLFNKNPLALEILQNHLLFGNLSELVEIMLDYEKR